MNPQQFVDALCQMTFENVFNPYSSRCPIYDLRDAPNRRKAALLKFLEAAAVVELDSIWIGRDLGYRGGRRTGLALTDDVHLNVHAQRWGTCIERATNGSPIAERTAAIVWSILTQIEQPIFLWNVFPFHPHEPNDPLSNRTHNSYEREAGEAILAQLILMLRPKRLVAIGNDAAKVARRIGHQTTVAHVRHPSYGGQTEFLTQIESLYKVRQRVQQDSLF